MKLHNLCKQRVKLISDANSVGQFLEHTPFDVVALNVPLLLYFLHSQPISRGHYFLLNAFQAHALHAVAVIPSKVSFRMN